MKAKIVDVHERDNHFNGKESLIGLIGEFNEVPTNRNVYLKGCVAGDFISYDPERGLFFYAVKVEEVK